MMTKKKRKRSPPPWEEKMDKEKDEKWKAKGLLKETEGKMKAIRLTPINEKEDDIKRKDKEGEENRRGRDPANFSGQRTQNGKKRNGRAKCSKK